MDTRTLPGRYALRHDPAMLTVPSLEDACLIVREISRGHGGAAPDVTRHLDRVSRDLHRHREARPAEGLVASAVQIREAEDILDAAGRLDKAVRLRHTDNAGLLPSGELVIIMQLHLESLHRHDAHLAS